VATVPAAASLQFSVTGLNFNIPAFPLLAARFATYPVRRVEYADGTVWAPASANH
jgi:hypothetical protein